MTRKTGLDWQLSTLGGVLLALTVWGVFAVDTSTTSGSVMSR